MADKECSSKIWAFIGGALLGAAIGILYAPDSGKNTRAKLKSKLRELGEKLQKIKEQRRANKQNSTGSASSQTGGLREEDYKKAEALLLEIENLYKQLEQ